MNEAMALFLNGGNSLQQQYESAARRADVNRLIAGIQHQNRALQSLLTIYHVAMSSFELAAETNSSEDRLIRLRERKSAKHIGDPLERASK